MKRFLKLLFTLYVLLFGIVHASQKTFKVSYDPDYAPFSYISNGEAQGLLVDYWKLWAQKNNHKIEFVNGILWDDAITMVQDQKVDFFLGTHPYEDWMLGSKSFYKTKTSLFTQEDNRLDFSKYGRYRVGIIGEDYTETIKKHFPQSSVIVYEDYESVIKDLMDKKIDMLYDDKLAIEFYTLQNRLFHKIKPLQLLNKASDMQAIALSQDLIDIFNVGLKKITQEEFNTINNKWLIDEELATSSAKSLQKSFTHAEKEFIESNIIKVSVSKNWRPFTFESISGEPAGISSEIWTLIAQKAGLYFQYSFFENFTDQLDSIKNKNQDIIFSTGKTPGREDYALFTNEYIQFPISIVTLKDENFIEDIETISDKIIAVGENYTTHKLLKEQYPKLKFLLVNSTSEGLHAVESKRAFAYVDIKPSLTYNIAKEGLKNLKISGNTGLTFKLRMMIRKDYALLQSILNKTIKSINKEEITSIVKQWNNIQFEEKVDYTFLWLSLFIFILVCTVLIYFNRLFAKRNQGLEELVEQRTVELKLLNDELEQRVQESIKELKNTNHLLDEAQKIAKLGSFQYEPSTDTLKLSLECYNIFDLKPKSVIKLEELFSYVDENDFKWVQNEIRTIKKSKDEHIFECKIKLQNNQIKYIQVTSKAEKIAQDGSIKLIIGTLHDITQIKMLEEEKREQDSILAQQAKMAAMGEMLDNIAHQWRQPLSTISTASTGMEVQLQLQHHIPEEVLLNNIKTINEQSQYLSKTIDDFRNFFNPNKINLEFNIQHCIDKSLDLLHFKIKKYNIIIHKEVTDLNIFALESELIQVLLNIMNNAIDALQDKENDKRLILIKAYTKEDYLYITVTDNAGGIADNIINRVFEPYFTTKHQRQGTGIGLYMSTQITSKHLKGSLNIENKEYDYKGMNYKGAQFTVCIPQSLSNELK